MKNKRKTFSIAPMMDWTDRHCRYFHRQITQHALLYTEMVTAAAIRHGDRERLLGFSPQEQQVALQLGGSDISLLRDAARYGEDYGYCEINLNVGCPSDRVQEGRFGACLMAEPQLVADCVAAMQAVVKVPVTVKCRIGIDEQSTEQPLNHFIETVSAANCKTFIIHARKAWLKGLSPKENRDIPPLDYDRVQRLKKDFPHLNIMLNGGLADVPDALKAMGELDGVMLGRAIYHNPWLLSEVDPLFYGENAPVATRADVVLRMRGYIEKNLAEGVWLSKIARHMLGLFHGQPGGRLWRQIISEESHKPGADFTLLEKALAAVKVQYTKQRDKPGVI